MLDGAGPRGRGERAPGRRGPGAGLLWQGLSFLLGLGLERRHGQPACPPPPPGHARGSWGRAEDCCCRSVTLGLRRGSPRAGGRSRPLWGAPGPGPGSQVSALSRAHAPHAGDADGGQEGRPGRAPPGRRGRTGLAGDWEKSIGPAGARACGPGLHSQAGSPCAESPALPSEKKKASRSRFSYSGCLPGPRAFPKGGQEGRGLWGRRKGEEGVWGCGASSCEQEMRRSHHHLLLLLCAGEDREETAPRGGAGGGGGLPCPGRGPASHKQAPGAQDTRVQFQIKARHVRVAAPCQAQMANDVPDLQAQGGHRASSAVALGLLCPPTPSAHQASSRLSLPGAPDSAASPLALHPRRTCLPSEGEGERGSGEGCPHPTVASAEEPSPPPGPGHSPPGRRPCRPFRHPQTFWGRAPSPSVQGQAHPSPICQPPPALSHQPPRPQAVAQERPCPRSPAASPTTSPRQCSCRGLALTLLARVQQVLLQVAPEHPLLRAALLLSFLPGLHGWGHGALAQPPTPEAFALPVPHGIPSWPPGPARPQGGGGPGSRQRLLPLEPWPHGSGRGRGSCQDPGKKLRLVARTGTRPARPTQPWGGGAGSCAAPQTCFLLEHLCNHRGWGGGGSNTASPLAAT